MVWFLIIQRKHIQTVYVHFEYEIAVYLSDLSPILCRRHAHFLLETFTEIARVVDTDHIGYLRHGILSGFYQLDCTVDAHFLDELDRRQTVRVSAS